jgi:hypothetical protein
MNTRHCKDDLLLVDGKPRSANRKPRRSRSTKSSTTTTLAVTPEMRDKALVGGKVVVTDAAGNVSITEPASRDYGRARRTEAQAGQSVRHHGEA